MTDVDGVLGECENVRCQTMHDVLSDLPSTKVALQWESMAFPLRCHCDVLVMRCERSFDIAWTRWVGGDWLHTVWTNHHGVIVAEDERTPIRDVHQDWICYGFEPVAIEDSPFSETGEWWNNPGKAPVTGDE